MPKDLKIYSERSRYRLGSTVLISAFCLALASALIGVPAWLIFIVGVAAWIALTIITYHRLRNAELSSGWLLLMILQFGVGPTWYLSDYVTLNLGGSVIGLVPVILGWIVPAPPNRKVEPKSV